jgi:hypothetical protein
MWEQEQKSNPPHSVQIIGYSIAKNVQSQRNLIDQGKQFRTSYHLQVRISSSAYKNAFVIRNGGVFSQKKTDLKNKFKTVALEVVNNTYLDFLLSRQAMMCTENAQNFHKAF